MHFQPAQCREGDTSELQTNTGWRQTPKSRPSLAKGLLNHEQTLPEISKELKWSSVDGSCHLETHFPPSILFNARNPNSSKSTQCCLNCHGLNSSGSSMVFNVYIQSLHTINPDPAPGFARVRVFALCHSRGSAFCLCFDHKTINAHPVLDEKNWLCQSCVCSQGTRAASGLGGGQGSKMDAVPTEIPQLCCFHHRTCKLCRPHSQRSPGYGTYTKACPLQLGLSPSRNCRQREPTPCSGARPL